MARTPFGGKGRDSDSEPVYSPSTSSSSSSSSSPGGLTAFIDQGSEFEGKLSFKDTVRIDGRFRGEISSENTLIVGEVTGGGRGSHRAHMWATWDLLDSHDGINGPFTRPGGAWAADEHSSGTYTGFRDTGFSSFHPGGCQFAMADGSVQFLGENTASEVLAALTTRAGGEIASGGF